MPIQQRILVNNIFVPTFFYGTAWKEEDTQRCVRDALQAGFTGIDTANQRKHYFEAGVGAALLEAYQTGTITRQEIFLQTKFTHLAGQDQRLPYDAQADIHTQVMQSFASSLEHLHTDYLDSYVLHGPSTRPGLADQDWKVWQAMEELQNAGKVKLLGISNVTLDQIQELYKYSKVKPSFLQNRCYANRAWDYNVREFCNKNSIHYQGFSLLTANSNIFQDPSFQAILQKYSCTPAQLVFNFALQAKMIVLTGTNNPKHMQEDLLSYNFEINEEERQLIEFITEA